MLNCWCITWPVGFKRLNCDSLTYLWPKLPSSCSCELYHEQKPASTDTTSCNLLDTHWYIKTSCFRRSVVDLWPSKKSLHPSEILVEQVRLPVFPFSAVSIIPPMAHMQSFITDDFQTYQEKTSLNNARQIDKKSKEKPTASIFMVHI